MRIDEFEKRAFDELNDFFREYREGNKGTPDEWPIEMEYEDWFNQLESGYVEGRMNR